MQITLTPQELQTLVSQIVYALTPAFDKAVSKASKERIGELQTLTVEDVAKRLKCCKKTVLKYVEDGRLEAANIGYLERPQYRVDETDLAAFFKAHRIGR